MLLLLLKIIIYPLSLLPLSVIRLVLFPVKFILKYVLKYRDKVISKNLKIAFPLETEDFYKKVKSDFYDNFFYILTESIKSFTINIENGAKRIPTTNPEVMNQYADKNQNIILAFGHFNNWEWTMFTGLKTLKHLKVAIFQPLKNEKINSWIKNNRSRVGAKIISTKEVKDFYATNKKLTAVAFIADQSPSRNGNGVWVDFFGRKTFFTSGMAATAINKKEPIVFVDIQRIKPGKYKVILDDLIPNPADYTVEQVMQIYATRMEKQITENPGNWLWSHNRWKHEYKPQN